LNPDLSVKINKILLKNPVMNASGTLGYNKKLESIFDFNNLGAYITKTLMLRPNEGFKPPRILETPAGIINSVGGQNVGVDYFIEYEYPKLCKLNTAIIVNIAAPKLSGWKTLVNKISRLEKVKGIELNLSCPHQYREWGSLPISANSKLVYKIINKLSQYTNLPLIAKLTPNVNDIQPIAIAAEKAGAIAISLINTVAALAIDINDRKPTLGNIYGGLSGPCIKPIGLYHVWQASSVVNIPIIGIGGITNYSDALEYIMAGATAIAVGTYTFRDPKCIGKIIKDLRKYMISRNIHKIEELIGIAKKP